MMLAYVNHTQLICDDTHVIQ